MHPIGSSLRDRPLTLIAAPLVSICLVLGAAGCGQRGPLYLPDREPPAGTAPADANGAASGNPVDDTGGQAEADANERDEKTS